VVQEFKHCNQNINDIYVLAPNDLNNVCVWCFIYNDSNNNTSVYGGKTNCQVVVMTKV